MMTLLAETAAAVPDPGISGALLMQILGWVTSFVVAISAAISIKGARENSLARGRIEGKAEAMQIGPQPFMVELKEQFVTRREFDRLESVIAVNTAEMKGLFRETMGALASQSSSVMKRMENQNDRITKKIEEVASGAYLGRQRLHNTQNEHTGKIAALEAVTNVAAEIEKAGKVIADAIHPK